MRMVVHILNKRVQVSFYLLKPFHCLVVALFQFSEGSTLCLACVDDSSYFTLNKERLQRAAFIMRKCLL